MLNILKGASLKIFLKNAKLRILQKVHHWDSLPEGPASIYRPLRNQGQKMEIGIKKIQKILQYTP